jgi:hypothetical protein
VVFNLFGRFSNKETPAFAPSKLQVQSCLEYNGTVFEDVEEALPIGTERLQIFS